jgi:multidrug efflux pump subunit AcrA (membrane-fusion protein)
MKAKIFIIVIAVALAACGKSKNESDEAKAHDEHAGAKLLEVSAEAREKSEITIETAGPATLKKTVKLNGKIIPNEERIAHVSPRFPGIVKEVRKRLGDRVEKGEALAVVESNDSLRPYEVKSEIAGTVIEKKITLGEFADTSSAIFVVADLSEVWVDLSVYRSDAELLKQGQRVLISTKEKSPPLETTIAYLSPYGAETTQTTLARCVLPNPNGELKPGLFVIGQVVLEEKEVPVAVKTDALQMVDEKPVVFVAVPKGFEMREVETGERDEENTEIRHGVKASEKYAAENSFALKSHLANSENEEE